MLFFFPFLRSTSYFFFFFFQAEDGIRDATVTGVQTCALPILQTFDSECRLCPRLAGFLDQVKTQYPTYYAKPVPPFGDSAPRLLIVGLAPGLHGANRTGRPFTGDYAGILLYGTLHRYGFASHEGSSDPGDGLELIDCRVANAVKCLPPPNKTQPDEVRRCSRYH